MFRVIEGQARHVVHAEPAGIARIGRCLDVVIAQVDERVIGDGDDPLPRIAVDRRPVSSSSSRRAASSKSLVDADELRAVGLRIVAYVH
jgi:hypothetical protein